MMGDAGGKFVRIMGDHYQSLVGATAKSIYHLAYPFTVGCIKSVQRLVKDKQFGILYKGTRQEDKTLLATGKREECAICQVFNTEHTHPFLADVKDNIIDEGKDILADEPYECPMAPFGGTEQLAWSPDSKYIAYACRKKTGRNYAISTDSDIYLYNVENGETKNLCKYVDFKQPDVNSSKSMQFQDINQGKYLDRCLKL